MAKHYSPFPQNNGNGGEIDLEQQIRSLFAYKKPILIAVLAGGLLGALYSFSATPVYRADAVLEIETKQNQILSEINAVYTPNNPPTSDAEIELVQSRLVIGKTVDDLQLDQTITPEYFPVFGRLVHNLSNDVEPELKIHTFTVDKEWLNDPFTLTATGNKTYKLELPNGKVLEGQVGRPLKINAKTTLQVNQILAAAGQKFSMVKHSRLSAIEKIKQNLTVSSKGKTSPIINLAYTGEDSEQIHTVLNSIADNYVNQNINRDVQVAASGLAFISDELPRLRETLQDAENKLNEYRKKSGSLDIPVESKGALESLINIESQITTLKTEEAGMAELYTPEHPSYKAVLDKLAVLQKAKNKINQQIADLPNTQQEIIRLTRDVETNQTTYTQLLAKQQELNILKASSQGNVRIIDYADVPEKPVAPRKGVITLLAALTAGMIASAWYLLRSGVRKGLTAPSEIEHLGMEVAAIVPLSKAQSRHSNKLKPLTGRSDFLLGEQEPTDAAVEALRALRTNIYFSMIGAKNNILMVTGSAPDVGKSFISANLSTVMAQSGKKILLIDADMRKGYLDQLFNARADEGLAEILEGKVSPGQAVQETQINHLDFISHGTMPENPSELLMDGRLKSLLLRASQRYDYVIIDTPPVLSVTDANIVGQHAGITLLVTRYNMTTARELDNSINRLSQSNVDIHGVILNGMKRNSHDGYAYYAAYVNKDKK
ncbi:MULTISPECIES: polysaccharide biosynthesis tyrosine autokinase [unclassified Neisseria]|uniref:polysaccharide biosynthesis tyrosine autokinase n=1 Tax=unclassified Neisseria TaxID=2623750 RepID=UPI0026655856|nr:MULTISPECIES: polysaccharide biosynthesis tyrosine autokinase [unclassified Neisseria]MDO1509630.1 polysaccharide biosynthesis tyrosine autokinase [Neisseria sp. MVDL19-042950]MDO1515598.1 polysaccharide biosynthesis tyrosine autokinase [Neisseria sp. MVDL18-041461]MDO1564023.1 polysaccharide biosynthesis tyrosine autokinase [Neisseria sp. MVDL20-010259]